MEAQSITIALEDTSAGYEATPDRVRLSVLASFTSEVQEFLRGESKEIDTAQLDVAVIKGSYGIYAPAIPTEYEIFNVLREMAAGFTLKAIDPKRWSIVDRWQRRSKNSKEIAVRIESPALSRPIRISADTDFVADDSKVWLEVERYVRGELQDLGGSTKPNAHLRLPDGQTLYVATDRDTVRKEKENLVFQFVTLRIKAKMNLLTGELKHARLIDFVDYRPEAEEDLTTLRTRAAIAWKDVPNASDWVDTLRGGESD